MESPDSKSTRPRAWTWSIRIGLLMVLAYHVAVLYPRTVRADCPVRGIDAADYVLLSGAIADGKGYVEPYTPGNPPHTRLPPLFPAFLALVRMAGGSIAAFYGFVLACSLAGLLLIWTYMRPMLGDGWALAVTAATALTPAFIQFSGRIMTEVPFVPVLFATLLLVRRAATAPPLAHRWTVATALAVGMATLLRSVGVALLPATAWHFWRADMRGGSNRRRALLLLAVALLPFALWLARNRWSENVPGTTYAHLASLRDPYDLDRGYAGAGDLAHRIARNTVLYAQELTKLAAFDFPARVPSPWSGLGYVLVPLLLVLGGVMQSRRLRDPSPVFLAVFLAILLVWPWFSLRFLVPVIPLVLACLLTGLRAVVDSCFRRGPWLIGLRVLLAAVLLVLWFVPRVNRHSWAVSAYLEESPQSLAGWQDNRDLRDWLDVHGQPDDVLLCWCAPIAAWVTGHPCVEYERTKDPGALGRVLDRYQVRWILISNPAMTETIEPQLLADSTRFPLAFHAGGLMLYSVRRP